MTSLFMSITLSDITYIDNCSDGGNCREHGGEKQFTYVTTRPPSPPKTLA